MSLIILTSGNKIMINESELRLFMSFKGLLFGWQKLRKAFICWFLLAKELISVNSPEINNLWVVLKLCNTPVLFPAAFIVQHIVSVSVYWFLAPKSCTYYEDEVKLTLPTTKNNCSLYLHRHDHHNVCIVFPPPLPTHHFYNNCFHTATTTIITFLLFSLHHDNHHHFSIFSLHHYHHHHHRTNSETFIDLKITSQENLSNGLNHVKK